MKHFKLLISLFLLQVTTALGQMPIRHFDGKVTSEYNKLKYDIINIDTITLYYSNGKTNSPDFKMWDSTRIWADIILKNVPKKFDSSSLKQQIETIMKRHGISKASVFRDEYSSILARLSSTYAYQKLKERQGYFGIYTLD